MRTRLYGKWAAWAAGLAVVVLLMSLPSTLLAQYDVGPKLSSDGNPVPDVDKPNLADQSCWLAAAANVLGGAGWGAGANAQAKAVNIYTNDLMPHFGNGAMLGWSSIAINWWLLNHGYNPNSPDYNPNLTYNNVTIIRPPQGFVNLTMPQYDTLLTEVSNCQYVNVSFDPPSPGHEMTLVGGNFSNTLKPAGSVSLWHDNNGDVPPGPGTDTEIAPNVPPANNTWFINHRNLPQFYGAKIATVLCPGLQKPDAAMKNFDIAWFKDMKQVGGNDVLFNAQRVAGNKAGQYHGPDGSTNIEWAGTTLQPEAVIPNQMMPEPWYKEVYLLVDFIDPALLVGFPTNITLKVGNNIYNPVVKWDDDGGQALFYWKLDDEDGQPPSESLVFPDPSYKNLYDISTGLGGPVKDWNVATLCSPEPATLMLLVVGGGLALLRRRRTAA